ncbi:MAG: hypothetical protein FJY67_03915 [Calditrichaeota bacterium]|nr:hypothetical protein [Calditrichota bacterium]
MLRKLTGLIALAALAIASPVKAQAFDDELNTGFGFSFGRLCGNGFSIRHLRAEGWGYQSGGIYFRNSERTYASLGGQALYTLNRTDATALYLLAGLAYNYSRSDESYHNDTVKGSQYELVRTRDEGVAIGAGLGLAFHWRNWERLWGSVDLALAAYKDDVLPYPQFGIHYMFK